MGYAEAIKILKKKVLVTQTELADRLGVTFVRANRQDSGMHRPAMNV